MTDYYTITIECGACSCGCDDSSTDKSDKSTKDAIAQKQQLTQENQKLDRTYQHHSEKVEQAEKLKAKADTQLQTEKDKQNRALVHQQQAKDRLQQQRDRYYRLQAQNNNNNRTHATESEPINNKVEEVYKQENGLIHLKDYYNQKQQNKNNPDTEEDFEDMSLREINRLKQQQGQIKVQIEGKKVEELNWGLRTAEVRVQRAQVKHQTEQQNLRTDQVNLQTAVVGTNIAQAGLQGAQDNLAYQRANNTLKRQEMAGKLQLQAIKVSLIGEQVRAARADLGGGSEPVDFRSKTLEKMPLMGGR